MDKTPDPVPPKHVETPRSASFDEAVKVVLAHEGGYVDRPEDAGGPTKYGVSLAFALRAAGADLALFDLDHNGRVDMDDIRVMELVDALRIYRAEFWDRYDYGQIRDQTVATKIFDTAVNVGPKKAHVLAQRSAIGCDQGRGLDLDGVLGPKSIAAINACDPDAFVREFCTHQAHFYLELIDIRPRLALFRAGWMARASWPLKTKEAAA